MRWNVPNVLTVFRLIAAPAVILVYAVFATPLSHWVALILFVCASVTDWIDGHLARRWAQESRFGAMLDPIADKAMVIIAVTVVLAASGLSPWLIVPGAAILFREVFVSGLREFLGSRAGTLKVTKLAKWKTTTQMFALTFLLLGLALADQNNWLYRSMQPDAYFERLESGLADFNSVWLIARGSWLSWNLGVVLFWISAILTVITGWDYLNKARPYLQEDPPA